MNLAELRDEVRTNKLRDVSDLVGGEADLQFSDASLDRYINEGYHRALQRLLPYRRSFDDVTVQLALTAGTRHLALPAGCEKILAVHVVDGDERYALARERYAPPVEGKPRVYSTGELTGQLTVSPYPTENLTIELRAAGIYPTMALDTDTPVGVLESHHMMLADWAAWRAVKNMDVEFLTPERQAQASSFRKAYDEALREALYFAKSELGEISFGTGFYHGNK